MKKIRLVDQTEIEIYNITQSGDTLQIDILNGDATALEETFKDADNLSVIQYYIEEDLMIAYARFDQLQSYTKRMGQVLAVDYTIEDETTDSGFAETKADVLTVTLAKLPKIVDVANQTDQNTADIDYIAMETGVNV
jgi:hypothetical protein|uniref:Uncharacterized protein n=1 Tax=Siphoviridae sp. ctoyo6 TaxID=2825674 RepID=A0A8S5U360_9CAUD|nr:MAG TPA: hypothetical protein [Siphoviridae sp. ctoyo6]DAR18420.1 MAG TPA: hypothetical protein [Caudoviricetes sp.]